MDKAIFNAIRPGDRVTIVTPHGNKRSGKARILNRMDDTVVLDGGGRYGTPLIATPSNTVAVKKAKKPEWGIKI